VELFFFFSSDEELLFFSTKLAFLFLFSSSELDFLFFVPSDGGVKFFSPELCIFDAKSDFEIALNSSELFGFC
jgi:hypothetical protein